MENSSVAFCVITGVIVYIIYTVVTKLGQLGRLYKHASKFEGPPGLPFIGNAHLFLGGREAIMKQFVKLGKTYPSPYRLWIGSHLLFFVNTPEQIQVALLSPKVLDKSEFYDFARPWLGTGLVTAPGAKWRIHRKLIQPTFHLNILQSFIETFATQSSVMVDRMEKNLDGPEFEIYNCVVLYFLSSLCETIMGVRLDAQTGTNDSFIEAVNSVFRSVCDRSLSPWLHPDFIFYRTQMGKTQQKDVKIFHDFTAKVIERKKEALLECSSRSGVAGCEDDKSNSMPRRKAFLDHLMELFSESGTLSDEGLREEVDTMIVAAHDTTALVSCFVMLMLASHPEIQERAYQELYEIYGEDEGEEVHVVPEDLTRMIYLERVIKETLRLFPLAPIIGRSVTEDFDMGEHTFPKGSALFIGIMDVHRNPDYWPDPLKFDPDRFLPEEVAKRHAYAYLPFSSGPRSCIGLKYAMMSMKILVSTILRRYVLKKDRIIPVKDIRLEFSVLLNTTDPISLRIENRTRKVTST